MGDMFREEQRKLRSPASHSLSLAVQRNSGTAAGELRKQGSNLGTGRAVAGAGKTNASVGGGEAIPKSREEKMVTLDDDEELDVVPDAPLAGAKNTAASGKRKCTFASPYGVFANCRIQPAAHSRSA